MTEPTRPTYCVTVGTEDLTDLIDMDTLTRAMSERGESVCTFEIPLSDENEVASNALVRDAQVLVSCDGATPWVYHVGNVSQPDPGDPRIVVECPGQWDVLHQKEDYCKGFVETRYEGAEIPSGVLAAVGTTPAANISSETDGHILLVLPKGSPIKADQGNGVYVWPMGPLDTTSDIFRVTANITTSGGGSCDWYCYIHWTDPFDYTRASTLTSGTTATGTTSFDSGDLSGAYVHRMNALSFYLTRGADTAGLAQDESVQIRDLKIYFNRTTAPRVDQAALEIWTDITGLTDSRTEAIGSALTQCMIDPFTNGADAIQQVLAKATTPPLCGVIHNQFRCINRPTAPADNTRLWVVSDQTTPGLKWNVKPDMAQSKDYIAFTYTQIIPSPTTTPSGLPARIYYPSNPPNNLSRVALIDSGAELTDAEALAFAEQAYHYYHEPWQGSVTIPYKCFNGNGQECDVDHIEAWDWVYNAGKANTDEAGPFLISEVSHAGGIAILTIGATEGYSYESPYRLPTKGRYVGAHRTRRRELWTKWWKRTHKGKPIPKKHPKWHYGAWKEVEGKYV